MYCSFPNRSSVAWSTKTPMTWRFTLTPGPMVVVSARFHDGTASRYTKFLTKLEDGLCITPGWIITVEYEVDSTAYYDPPRSSLFQKQKLQMEVHEMWLVPNQEA